MKADSAYGAVFQKTVTEEASLLPWRTARENLERIFDVFFSTKGARGFGLGLFVARSIAERHGGLLWAESEEGRGAVMMLELPAGGRAGNARESQTPSFRGGSSMPYSSSL